VTGRGDIVGLERRVEDVLAERMPDVDLLELVIAGEMMRVVIDHPEGVDHDLCAAVTRALGEGGLLEEYGAEVWSPGPEPPLRRPEHFRRAIGRRVKIRTEDEGAPSSHVGTLERVDDDAVRIVSGEAAVRIPFESIRRARALEDSG
jgi:ribosome maturation factor RimP